MATLEDAIKKIDLETRELLATTFDQVNEHFGRMFPTLFGGGTARLVMTGDEILDAGVQVMAQPPGKKNSSIHLLSGGEKALTAIALVFAIFQLNPAPFCLLDEVDAPLDDANTERYAKLVTEMAQGDPVPLHQPQPHRHGNGRAADRRDDAGAGRLAHRHGRHAGRDAAGRSRLSDAQRAVNSLTVALASLGGVVLAGVVAHGAWQARRAGPKRATPAEREEPSALAPARPRRAELGDGTRSGDARRTRSARRRGVVSKRLPHRRSMR